MAISKILYMKDCGRNFPGKHLKVAIEYISVPDKTQNGKFVAGLNCQPDAAYEQMKQTKIKFGKTDKRQGYHLIISFEEGEVDADTAFEIIGKIAKEYLGEEYEAVYAVHDNTEHIHGHICFNSVSFKTGKKYRYEKGDWARDIQPITNRLCEADGLSTIELSEDKAKSNDHYKEWNDFRDGKFVWGNMIKRDLDTCIMQAPTFDSFLELLADKGYEIKQGKYFAIRPPGMYRFKRCKSLGEDYTEERIRERVFSESLSDYRPLRKGEQPRIVTYKIKRLKRAKMSGLQKRYFAKLYRIGQLKKKPYSQAWRYKDDIRKMHKLQEQYLFLSRHDIRNIVDLAMTTESLTAKKAEVSKEKSRVFKARAKCNSLFQTLDEMQDLKECENSYQSGDNFFEEEHQQWTNLFNKLLKEGYKVDEVEVLKEHYRNEIALVRDKEKAAFKELNLAKSIMNEILHDSEERKKEEEIKKTQTQNSKKKQQQPIL
ncbi:MAG: relaxase/mobilization nuclease domain-containing protein [Mobilitalea sp.]